MRMNHRFWIAAISVALLTLGHSGSRAQDASRRAHAVPDLSTDLAKVRYLGEIQKNIPNLFQDAVRYQIDLFKLLEQQEKIASELSTLPEYEAQVKGRAPLISISIQGQVSGVDYELTHEQVENWKMPLIETLERIPPDQSVAQYEEALRKKVFSPGGSSLLGALVQVLPADKKPGFKSATTIEEKIAYLRENLPALRDGRLPESFRAAQFNIPPTATKDEIIGMVGGQKNMIERDRSKLELALLTEIKAFAHVKNPKGDLTKLGTDRGDLIRQIRQLTSEDLIWARDPKHIEEVLPVRNSGMDQEYLNQIADRAKKVKALAGTPPEGLGKKGRPLKLMEVPAGVGIFRGCTGRDCSSQYSFAYPNDPNEKVFFVMDQDGRVKGYVSATRIDAGGKPHLYVHTIAGKLSSGDTRAILGGLSEARKELKVEGLVIPHGEKLEGLINYDQIRNVFNELGISGKPVEISYLDAKIRKKIEGFEARNNDSRYKYDHMESNKKGFFVDPENLKVFFAEPSVTVENAEALWKKSAGELDREQMIRFALDLSTSQRHSELNRVLGALGISKEFESFLNLLENRKRLSVSQYENQIRNELKKLGVSNPSDGFIGRASLPGLSQCPDLLSDKNKKRTLERIKSETDHLLDRKTGLIGILFDHKEDASLSPDFQKKIMVRAVAENANITPELAQLLAERIESGKELLFLVGLEDRTKDLQLFWSQVPGLLNNPQTAEYGAAVLRNQQGSWPPEVWREVPGFLKRTKASARFGMIRALGQQSHWPDEVWHEMTAILKGGEDYNQNSVILALGKQSHWPPEVWREVPRILRLEKGEWPWDFRGDLMSDSLGAQSHWPDEFWREVPGLLQVGVGNPDSFRRMVSVLENQSHWPPAFFAELDSLKASKFGFWNAIRDELLFASEWRRYERTALVRKAKLWVRKMNGVLDQICK